LKNSFFKIKVSDPF